MNHQPSVEPIELTFLTVVYFDEIEYPQSVLVEGRETTALLAGVH